MMKSISGLNEVRETGGRKVNCGHMPISFLKQALVFDGYAFFSRVIVSKGLFCKE